MSHHLFLYMIAVLTIALFPGPDMLYIIGQSLGHGKRFGLAAALGIGTGCFVHIFAVSIGLSSLIFNSSIAFTLIKYLGACYLLYLGIMSVIKKQSILLNPVNTANTASWNKAFIQGFLINVFNPKVALFFLAFLPQFVDSSSTHSIAMQLLFLGLIFNSIGTTINMSVGLFFGAAKHWLSSHPTALKIQQKVTGFILIGLGLRLATTTR